MPNNTELASRFSWEGGQLGLTPLPKEEDKEAEKMAVAAATTTLIQLELSHLIPKVKLPIFNSN